MNDPYYCDNCGHLTDDAGICWECKPNPRMVESIAQLDLGVGRKNDDDKVKLELIPPELIFAVGHVLTFGANKYAPRNWEKGISYSRVFGAAMRHLWSWWGGKGPTTKSFLFEDLDGETGVSHLWHAACCVAFLLTYEERRMSSLDDRFGGS